MGDDSEDGADEESVGEYDGKESDSDTEPDMGDDKLFFVGDDHKDTLDEVESFEQEDNTQKAEGEEHDDLVKAVTEEQSEDEIKAAVDDGGATGSSSHGVMSGQASGTMAGGEAPEERNEDIAEGVSETNFTHRDSCVGEELFGEFFCGDDGITQRKGELW